MISEFDLAWFLVFVCVFMSSDCTVQIFAKQVQMRRLTVHNHTGLIIFFAVVVEMLFF